MDVALIASECIDTRIRGEVPRVMCKLDIEKAFDHLNWSFLLNTLRQMRFGRRLIKWIEFCIKTTRFSILINGEPAGFFLAERGLRQGDPLSPFLFIIAMEGLGSMMRRATTNNWIKGFNIKDRNNEIMEVTHLLCADDTVVFCEVKQEQICYLRVILVIFEAFSRLKINWRKSNIFLVKEVQQIQSLADILRCKTE
ncbi:secreted RxLR effector protein 78-like [Solanum stenotomum]|uniref:secreted RxLR effector protein 78-like n=1 Tax=Solanum stenotomum TaxID=172797 RepID=UPI0020D1A6D5|nr:secreted RxLR effector protein 78-like [Solanum stenotomum]